MKTIVFFALLGVVALVVALTVIAALFFKFEVEYSEGYATKVKPGTPAAYLGPTSYYLHSRDGEWVSTAITFSGDSYHFIGIRPKKDGKYMAFLLIHIWERFTGLGAGVLEILIPIPAPR